MNKNNKVVFLLFCTEEYYDFLDKTLKNLQDISLQNCIIKILTDSKNLGSINRIIAKYQLHIVTEIDNQLGSFLSSSDGNYEYDNENFNQLNLIKLRYIQRNLSKFKHIIYSDVDIAWFRNPIDYLIEISKFHDLAFQSESQSGGKQTLCFGFVSIKSNIKTRITFRQIEKEAIRKSVRGKAKNDQEILNYLYKKNKLLCKNIFALPESLFINGLSYKLLSSEIDDKYFSKYLEPFMFHANWVIEKQVKMHLLKKYGKWD